MAVESEIASVLSKLFQTLDNEDVEGFADCWCEDLKFRVTMFDGATDTVAGRAAMVAKCQSFWTGRPSSLRHAVSAIWVESIGLFRVRARFYCQYFNVGATPSLAGMGEYRDELVRCEDGHWRVAAREHVFLTPLVH